MARSRETLWLAASTGFLGLGGVLLAVNASFAGSHASQGAFWTSGLTIAAYALGFLAVICFVGAVWQWPLSLTGAWSRRHVISGQPAGPCVVLSGGLQHTPQTKPGPAITDRWQSAMEDVSSEVLQLQNNGMSHPGYQRRSTQAPAPPSVRIGMMVACSQLDPAAPSTSEIRARFLSFLGQSPVMDAVRALTEVGEGLAWRAYDDNPRFNFGGVLSLADTEEAPIAWARLLVPEELTHRYGRDARGAYLVLYVEPRIGEGEPAPPASLVVWHQRLVQALKLPAVLAEFLAQQLGLSTSDDPLAEVGVWLNAPQALTELVDVAGFETVLGTAQTNWFRGFARAASDGLVAADMARGWLQQLCDSALHLDGHDAAVASLGTKAPAGPRLTVAVEPVWNAWRDIFYTLAVQITITNKTDAPIRIVSIDVSWDTEGRGPNKLPDNDEWDAYRQELAEQEGRYAPELASPADVPPRGSVSGWVVIGLLRPYTGGPPRLEVSIREAVGNQLLTVVPSADPPGDHPPSDADTNGQPRLGL